MLQGGIILINKPKNLTSHDVVDELRKITGIKKIGHAGTLDPFATGLLILLIGKEATKKQSFFLHQDKTYWAKIRLGVTSDTYDSTGKILEQAIEKHPDFATITKVKEKFVGEQFQTPPSFSAKKINGKKAYQLARQGKEVKLKPQKIKIHSLEILSYQWPWLELKTLVSAGTYIRSLVHDIGLYLQTGALVEELRREQIGDFLLNQAIDLKNISAQNWINYLVPINKLLCQVVKI